MLSLVRRILAGALGAMLIMTAPGEPFYAALAADGIATPAAEGGAGQIAPVVVPQVGVVPGQAGQSGGAYGLLGRSGALRFRPRAAAVGDADPQPDSLDIGSFLSPAVLAPASNGISKPDETPAAAPDQPSQPAPAGAPRARPSFQKLKSVFTTPISPSAVAATIGRKAAAPVTALKRMMRGDEEIRPFVMKYRKDFRRAQALLVADAVLSTAVSWGMGRMLDAAGGSAAMPKAVTLLVAYTAFSFFASVTYSLVERGHAWIKNKVGDLVVRDLRIHLFSHFTAQDAAFFKENKGQELAPRISEDVNTLDTTNVNIPAAMPYGIVSLAASTGMLFAADWRIALAVLATLPLFGLLASRYGNKFEKISEEFAANRARMVGEAGDSLSNMEVVKVFGSEDAMNKRFAKTVGALAENRLKMDRVYSWYWALSSSWGDMATKFFIIALGAWMLFYLGHPSAGAIMAMQGYAYGVKGAFQSLANNWTSYKDAQGTSKRIRELLARKPAVADRPGAVALGPIKGDIEFKEVDFAYDPATPVLRGVSFKVKPGQVAAFVGETGSGKSTVLRMLARLYDPASGSVNVDGRDLRDVQRKSLTSQMAIVPQDSALFDGTIRANLLAVQPDATEDQMRAALKAAHGEFVFDRSVCADGLDTDVGERGAKLSGGQKQRIAIARAILRNPRLLLLDEATSALDNQSESLVQDALRELMKGRTTFVVAHRLTTIQSADVIFVLDKGRIVESGTHWELIGRKGRYYQLWKAAGIEN